MDIRHETTRISLGCILIIRKVGPDFFQKLLQKLRVGRGACELVQIPEVKVAVSSRCDYKLFDLIVVDSIVLKPTEKVTSLLFKDQADRTPPLHEGASENIIESRHLLFLPISHIFPCK